MSHLNVEIKARCSDTETFEKTLWSLGADFHGVDHQVDTYFRVSHGRLKLREGNIENALIHYAREDDSGAPKKSHVTLYQLGERASELKNILSNSIGILVVVDKHRKMPCVIKASSVHNPDILLAYYLHNPGMYLILATKWAVIKGK